MLTPGIYNQDIDSFKKANSLLQNPSKSSFEDVFEEALEKNVKEQTKEKASELVDEGIDSRKKKSKETKYGSLPDITQITRNVEKYSSSEAKTYMLLDKIKDKKKGAIEEELNKGPRQQAMDNANFAGQAMFQPVYEQPQRRPNKAQMLEAWEKFAPVVTEDLTKKAIRIDIPLINDIQALILRMNPDRSISASLLGSEAMGELIKNNKDRLDRNLRHHQVSLREFNTYRSELEFNSEAGTKKNKNKKKPGKKVQLDLI